MGDVVGVSDLALLAVVAGLLVLVVALRRNAADVTSIESDRAAVGLPGRVYLAIAGVQPGGFLGLALRGDWLIECLFAEVFLVEGEDGVEGGLVDVAADVGLQVEEYFGQGQDLVSAEVLEDGVDGEHFAGDVHLPGDVHALEEVQAEGVDVLEVARLLALPVPQHALEPGQLGLQQGDIPVGPSDVRAVVFHLPHHLDEDLHAFGLDDPLPDDLQYCVVLAGVATEEAELLVFEGDEAQLLLHGFGEDHSCLEGDHLDLLPLVDLVLLHLLRTERLLYLAEKSRHYYYTHTQSQTPSAGI